MISSTQLEDGVKGDIHTHLTINGLPIAIGTKTAENETFGIAYIYNIPQNQIDRNFLAVMASENGGNNPEVAEPSPNEYVVGFDHPNTDEDTLQTICSQILSEINIQPTTQTQINTTQTAKTTIDLSDEFNS